ncbi:MAG: hypothetical protein LH650_13100 [Chloroflexi bacterium]|nr:hypothetical protein [Chloroflexota bacterium]
MTDSEGLDEGPYLEEPVSDVDPDVDSGYAPAETAVLGGMLDEAIDRDRDEGVESRERDADQGPPHVATYRGDGKAADTAERDQLGDDTDEDGARVG